MTETGGSKLHKARKTPHVVHSSAPPAIPATVEVAYHAIDRALINSFEKSWKEAIVTSQILYKPGILASARIQFSGTRWNLHHEWMITKVIPFPVKRQFSAWEQNLDPDWAFHDSRSDPEPLSLYSVDGTYDFSAENFESLREDFLDYLSSNEGLKIECNPFFKLDRKMDETAESFSMRCMEKAREELGEEKHQLEDTLQRHQDRLQQKLDREVRGIGSEARTSKEMDVQDEIEAHDFKNTIEDIKKELVAQHQMKESKMKEFEDNLVRIANERETEVYRINRSHIHLLQFGLIWLPYAEFVIQEQDSRRLELVQSF